MVLPHDCLGEHIHEVNDGEVGEAPEVMGDTVNPPRSSPDKIIMQTREVR